MSDISNIIGSDAAGDSKAGRESIVFKYVRSKNVRNMRITIYPTGEVKVTAPVLMPQFIVDRFVKRKTGWIEKKLDHFQKHPVSPERQLFNKLGHKDLILQKDKALELVTRRLAHFNEYYNLSYKKISIRNQRSRWGSCSHRGNISFNFKIVFLKPEVQDYIIVHELCHVKEMNHSKRFWDLVAEQAPGWKELRRELRKM